ncbi:MAG: alpha/beta hydrolase [Bifidobacteriaceae bacterium]|jgi:pimeloyl-ACP methyl ester carboxylesterase|nr:alpha/beta hydrolase [Bifidobacteriaceae bacterium]
MTRLVLHPRGALAANARPASAPTASAPAASAGTATVPLVLIHGFPVDHRMWEPVAELLADLPVLLVDLPGAGESPVAEPTIAAAARALLDSLAAAGSERAVLAGMSMGGYVALAAWRARPSALAGLGLVDTRANADNPATRVQRHAVARRVLSEGTPDAVAPMAEALVSAATRTERPELVDRIRGWIAQSVPAGIAWAEAAMAGRPDATPWLGSVGVPSAVIVGEDDSQSPPAVARAMAAALPDAELTQVPRAGHMSAVEEPVAVAGALRALHARATAR